MHTTVRPVAFPGLLHVSGAKTYMQPSCHLRRTPMSYQLTILMACVTLNTTPFPETRLQRILERRPSCRHAECQRLLVFAPTRLRSLHLLLCQDSMQAFSILVRQPPSQLLRQQHRCYHSLQSATSRLCASCPTLLLFLCHRRFPPHYRSRHRHPSLHLRLRLRCHRVAG
jgi:hypothetical protein